VNELTQWTIIECPNCDYVMRVQEGYHEDASGVFVPIECPKCRFGFNTGGDDSNE